MCNVMLTRFKQTFCRSKQQREQQQQSQQQQQQLESNELQQMQRNKSTTVTFSVLNASRSFSDVSTQRRAHCTTAKDILAVSSKCSESSRMSSGGGGDGSANAGPYTETTIQQATPVLFSTNRGLHLRVHNCQYNNNNVDDRVSCNSGSVHNISATATTTTTTPQSNIVEGGGRVGEDNGSAPYTISFCDLERWCTRANNLRLDDTFVLQRSRNVEMEIPHLHSASASTTSASHSSHSSALLMHQMYQMRQRNESTTMQESQCAASKTKSKIFCSSNRN